MYRQVLEREPHNPNANHNLAITLMQSGGNMVAHALPLFRQAWAADPSHQQHWLSYLRALLLSGDTATAEAVAADGQARGLPPIPLTLLSKGARTAPAQAASRSERAAAGDALRQQQLALLQEAFQRRDFAAAERVATTLIRAFPQDAVGWKYLGVALLHQNRSGEAIDALGEATRRSPADFELQRALADAFLAVGLPTRAEQASRQALSLRPDDASAISRLGRALVELHRIAEAEAILRHAVEVHPAVLEAHQALCEFYRKYGESGRAIEACRALLVRSPNDFTAYGVLGIRLMDEGRLLEAESLCREMLEQMPLRADLHHDLAEVLARQGKFEEARSAYHEAIDLRPDYLNAIGSWLFCSNYLASEPTDMLLAKAREFGHYASAAVRAKLPDLQHDCSPTRLRVGLVSGDLRNHPVGYFIESIVRSIDPARIELVAFNTLPTVDDLSARLQQSIPEWISLVGLSDEDAARRIVNQRIHILIDLSGHTRGSRLSMFSWRPARLQVSWLGYFATTGVAEMDYILADPIMVPEPNREQFTEKVWYLPTRMCFAPPAGAPEVAPAPVEERGYFTFGSFQELPKISDRVLAVWAEVLSNSPRGTRLRLQCGKSLGTAERESLLGRIRDAGIDPELVEFADRVSRTAYLDAYRHVDLVLDTFPYPGGTTTCEALWMGVPTLTLIGETMIARQGASLLTAAGLPEWIAASRQEYVDKAVAASNAPGQLSELRRKLRDRVRNSQLMDGGGFARSLEDALWAMWSHSAYSGRQC